MASTPVGDSNAATKSRSEGLAFGLSGLAFGILLLAGGLVAGRPPDIDASARDIVAFYLQHGAAQQVGNYMIGLSGLAFLLFLPGLMALLHRLEGEGGFITVAAVAAGISALGIGLIGTAAFQALAVGAGAIQDPNVVALVEVFARTARNLTYFPQVILIGLTSWALLRTGGAGRWIGVLGVIVSVLLLLGTLILVGRIPLVRMVDLLAFLGFGLWYVALGVTASVRALR